MNPCVYERVLHWLNMQILILLKKGQDVDRDSSCPGSRVLLPGSMSIRIEVDWFTIERKSSQSIMVFSKPSSRIHMIL